MLSAWFSPSSANALWAIFYLLVASVVTIAGYKIKTWPLVKQRITEAKLADHQIDDAKWKRFQDEIARLDERIRTLELELAASRERERRAQDEAAEARAEKARLEASIVGRGEGRQEAAILRSARRIVKDEKDGHNQD